MPVQQKLITRRLDETRNRRFIRVNSGALRQQQLLFRNAPRRNPRITIPRDHRQRAARQVSQTARQITVRAIDQHSRNQNAHPVQTPSRAEQK